MKRIYCALSALELELTVYLLLFQAYSIDSEGESNRLILGLRLHSESKKVEIQEISFILIQMFF
jgi:hypothetical protein